MRQIRRVKGVLSVERKESLGDSDLTLTADRRAGFSSTPDGYAQPDGPG
jgi:hypothetical protein